MCSRNYILENLIETYILYFKRWNFSKSDFLNVADLRYNTGYCSFEKQFYQYVKYSAHGKEQ